MDTEEKPKVDFDDICALVRTNQQQYVSNTTTLSKYVQFSLYENIEKIEAYLSSKHISGETDALGREKPFFNIVTAAVNIWYRATDIDRKDITIKASVSSSMLGAMLYNFHLQNWMRRANFGVLLNKWGRSLARYGSSIVKFVEKGDELIAEVMAWGEMIIDTVNINNDVQIQIIYHTPATLMKAARKYKYDMTKIRSIINAHQTRETQDKQKKDNKDNFIKLYEVHGELSLATLKNAKGEELKEGDDLIFVQQMHTVCYVAKKDKDDEYEDYTLYCGKESKNPYMLTHLIEEEGRSQGIGAVEHLFEAQWMKNHSVKLIKDQLDLASKLILQTADPNFTGMNAIDNVETGDILIHAENAPLSFVPNSSHDISALQAFGNDWKALAQEITSTPDAISGNTMPSGTAYRQVAVLNQEAHSLFEIMIENKSLAIEEMLRVYILPFLNKRMDTSDEIQATLDELGLKKVDLMYINAEVARRNNKKMSEEMFAGKLATPIDVQTESQNIQKELNMMGSQRFFKASDIPDKTWKELFKDLQWEVEIEISGESSNKEAIMTTLTTVLQTIAQNPTVLTDPTAKYLFNQILSATGYLSPVSLPVQDQPNPQSQGNQQPTGKIPSNMAEMLTKKSPTASAL